MSFPWRREFGWILGCTVVAFALCYMVSDYGYSRAVFFTFVVLTLVLNLLSGSLRLLVRALGFVESRVATSGFNSAQEAFWLLLRVLVIVTAAFVLVCIYVVIVNSDALIQMAESPQ